MVWNSHWHWQGRPSDSRVVLLGSADSLVVSVRSVCEPFTSGCTGLSAGIPTDA